MMGPSEHHYPPLGGTQAVHFGAFLKVLRHSYDIKQVQVLAVLPGWTQTSYSRLESDELAPAFDQLAALYAALRLAGAQFTPFDRHQFVSLARQRIEAKRSHQEHKSEQAWDELRLQLARGDHQESSDHLPAQDHLLETRHLVGRGEWLQEVLGLLQGEVPKKLLVLQGPIGSGKSSELHRLARSFLSTDASRPHLVLCELPAVERDLGAESALDIFLATVLAEVATPGSAMPLAELSTRVAFVLETLATTIRPTVLLLDNAEHLLDEHGQLAACWQQFLSQFLRRQHRACLVLATREWPGWFEGERLFVAEMLLPPLSEETGAVLLQHLGLTAVAAEHLRKVSAAVGGIPLCLEWVASLVQEPLLFDTWDDVDALNEDEHLGLTASHHGTILTQRLLALLDDPSLFGGPIASKLTPLLQRILDHRLSPEASQVLNRLAIANIPLGKPALQVLCPRPSLLKELRSTSLLAATAQRVQIVPMVSAQLRARLSMQQQHDLEEQLVPALTRWLDEGKMGTSEAGGIVAELAALYLKLHHLLKAAELLIRYGWLSFNQGYGPRLARLAQNRMQEFDWQRTEDNECGGLLLHNYLTPFLSKIIASRERMSDYQRIREVAIAEKVQFQAETEVHITHYLMLFALNELRFEEALSFFEACANRLKSHLVDDRDLQASLLEESTMLFGRWSEHAEEQREEQKARAFREQTITLYRQSVTLLSTNEELSLLKSNLTKKRLGRSLNSLAYQLYRIGQYDEALKCIDLSIVLKEQGYVQFGGLVAAYGDKSQILAKLGHFQEALHFDEKALKNVQLLANMGHALSQEEIWIYLVNRGCLYLRMGRIDEAERLLQDALPHIHPRRRVYHMLAKKALEEVEEWRQHATLPEHQLDWRWIQRYRDLDAFDAYWWWAQAGPFNEQEQQEWDQLYHPGLDEERKELLGGLIAQSRQRELVAALSEQREPHFHYPALDIQEVRRRISEMIQLDTEIQQTEPNVIVRRLYHDAIEEETNFLRMIEATYEGDSERFRALNQLVEPEPTFEEMQGALSSLRRVLVQGLTRPDTAKISQHLIQWLSGPLHLSFDFSSNEQEMQELRQNETQTHFQPQQTITPQAAKRFFNAILHESGYDEWQVVIDPKASGPRVDSALRHLYVPDSRLSTERIRHYLAHELAGHVARSVAGERSLLGLLGIGTKGYQPTEEGVAYHQERLAMALYGKVFDDSGTWFGTLATGFASGVATPPQTFLSLFPFFEALHLLFRLLEQQDKDVQTAQQRARSAAFSRCLRTYRGVPNLEKAGVCFSKDAVYFRGFRQVEDALAQDETILDRLSVGKVALEYLPEIQELGLAIPPHPLRDLAYDPQLEAYMLSFELHEEQPDQPA